MAVISDGPTVVFVKDNLRPLSESLRALVDRSQSAKTQFDGAINASGSPFNAGANSDTIAENRTAEGVPNLTKLQVLQFMGELATVLTTNAEIVQALCVRPLVAS